MDARRAYRTIQCAPVDPMGDAMTTHSHMIDLTIAGGLLLGLFAALEAGYRLGQHHVAATLSPPSGGQVGAIQGAMLGLLGLLLGFSFAGAASRFVERQDLIVQEANAIGTTYLRADLLPDPFASQVRHVLAEYVAYRLDGSQHLAAGLGPSVEARVAAFHARLWQAARDGSLARPELTKVVLDPVNEVIDLHTMRVASGRKHLPLVVLGLLIASSLLSMSVIGYGCGASTGGRWPWLNGSLAIIIAAALWTTIDLDHPRAGLIRLSDEPLQRLNLNPLPSAAER
jgi:hypothetical protein